MVVEDVGSISGAASVAERVVSVVKAERITFDDSDNRDDDRDEEEDEEDNESRYIGAGDAGALFVDPIAVRLDLIVRSNSDRTTTANSGASSRPELAAMKQAGVRRSFSRFALGFLLNSYSVAIPNQIVVFRSFLLLLRFL